MILNSSIIFVNLPFILLLILLLYIIRIICIFLYLHLFPRSKLELRHQWQNKRKL